MTRLQWTLAGLLFVQLVVIWIVAPWSGGEAASAPHPLLPDLLDLAAEKILITSTENDSVSLSRTEENWRLEEAQGYPADAEKVKRLLESLEELSVRRPVVSSARYHEALKVTEEDHERRLRIWAEGDEDPAVDLLLGSSPNYRLSHVRLVGDDRVYEARGLSKYELRADADSWIERRLMEIPYADVMSVRLRNSHGQFSLERTADGWSVASETASLTEEPDPSEVESFIRSVTSLRLSETAGQVDEAAHGLEDPVAELGVIAGSSAEPLTLIVGAEVDGGDGKRYASKPGSGFSVVLGKYDAEEITEKKLDDFYPGE
jgi:hypothetical protein